MCTGAYKRRGVEKLVIKNARTKWMTPNKCCGMFFVHWFGQVASVPARRMLLFSSIIITIILSYAIIRIYFPSLYSDLYKKTGIQFLHKYLFKIPLWCEIDNAISYFLISSKNLKWKQHFQTWKSKTRVTSYEFKSTSYEFKSAS